MAKARATRNTLPLTFPAGGVSELLSTSRQVPGTTRRAQNCHVVNPDDGRMMGAQRRGLAKFTSAPLINGAPVQAMDVCVFDSKGVDFAELYQGTDVKKWAAASATGDAASNPALDSQKNSYVVEGRSTIVKRNSDGVVQWIHQVSMPVAACKIAALAYDQDTDILYSGVGTTVQQDDPIGATFEAKGFLIRLKQKKDNKVEVSWKLALFGYVSNIQVVKGELFLTRDLPDRGQTYLEKYAGLADDAPTLLAQRRIPFPCSGMGVRETGVVYTVHPPSATRGLDPRAKGSTTKTDPLDMWTPALLKKVPNLSDPSQAPKNLLWSWHLADDLAADHTSGDDVLDWFDRSDNGRHLGQALSPLPGGVLKQPDPPLFFKESLGAEPGIRFQTDDPGGIASPQALMGMSSGSNFSYHKANAEQQNSLLPSFSNGTHVVCILARAGFSNAVSPLLFQRNDRAGGPLGQNDITGHGVFFNAKRNAGVPFYPLIQPDTGKVLGLNDINPVAPGIPQATTDAVNAMELVTLIYRGAGVAVNQFRVNGFNQATHTSNDFFGLGQTDVGWSVLVATGTGALNQIPASYMVRGFVGDIQEIVSVFTGAVGDADNTDARALQIAQLIEGYMAHRVGFSHKLDASHPYNDVGGPPPVEALTGQTPNTLGAGLLSQNSILAKWGSGRFELRAVDTTTDGHGYSVVVEPNTTKDVPSQFLYTLGPQSAGPGLSTLRLRRIKDLGGSFSSLLTDGAWTISVGTERFISPPTTPPSTAGDSIRVRMCCDGWGNVYVPIRTADAATYSVLGYSEAKAVIARIDLPSTLGGNGVCCLAAKDDYGSDLTIHRTESLWIASELSTGLAADVPPTCAHRVNIVSSTPNGQPSRQVLAVGVAGGYIRMFDSAGVSIPTLDTGVSDPPLSASALFISTTVAFGKVFFTDGTTYRYLDCKLKKVFNWASTTGGKLAEHQRLLTTWRARVMSAAGADDRTNWHAAASGDPFDHDERPEVLEPTQAISGNDARAGKPSDIITTLIPWDEDTLIVGGDHSISQITGDPMAAGTIDRQSSKLDILSKEVGMAFGDSWCQNSDDLLYFHDNRGAVHVMVAGSKPKDITDGKVEQEMRKVDLKKFHPVLAYDDGVNLLHVFYCPYDVANASADTVHYIYEEKVKAWWPVKFADAKLQPTCVAIMEGDDPADRTMLVGCADGYVRYFKVGQRDDDDVAIDSFVLIGPLAPEDTTQEFSFKRLQVVLANDQGGATYKLFGTDRADVLGDAKQTGNLTAGRNPPKLDSVRGSYVAIEIGSNQLGTSWAFDSAEIVPVPRGRKRIRQQ